MANPLGIINDLNNVLKDLGPFAETVKMRTITRTGGDPLIGRPGTVTFTDVVLDPQPYYTRIGREHVPGGHAESYDFVDKDGRQMLADDYRFIITPTAMTREQLENPNNVLTLTDADGNVTTLRLLDILSPSLNGLEVAFICFFRSTAEVPA